MKLNLNQYSSLGTFFVERLCLSVIRFVTYPSFIKCFYWITDLLSDSTTKMFEDVHLSHFSQIMVDTQREQIIVGLKLVIL